MTFVEKLSRAAEKNKSWLCVGLDPDTSRIPQHLGSGSDAILKFNKAVIESTADLVCAYKPNSAFYESLGADGMRVLSETIKAIPDHIPVIMDFKRGDIGNTAAMYARSAFEYYGADAVTVNPYLGFDSLEPFLKYRDKGIFILCLTSNQSSADIQKQIILIDEIPSLENISPQAKAKTIAEFFKCSSLTVYTHIARLAMQWNDNGNAGLVVGATSPAELEKIRSLVGNDMPILIPGVGAQGGDLQNAVKSGSNTEGNLAIVNVSRGIIYSGGGESFKEDIRQNAKSYKEAIYDFSIQKRKIRNME